MSNIYQVCAKFYNNPDKSFSIRDFKAIQDFNYGSVKVQLKRLQKYGIIRQLPSKNYILKDRDKAFKYLDSKSDSFRSPSLTPPYKFRAKAHDISIGEIDLSGEPLEWMLKLNMLTKPNPTDPAKNVGLRRDQAKRFNMRISLRTGKAQIYPYKEGWEQELLDIFSWCGDFINRLDNGKPNTGIALNYTDLQRVRPDLKNIPFEDIKGLVVEHEGMKIQLCASQFKEGEVCIHTGSLEETMSLADKITYGGRDLSQALKETAFEKQVFKQLEGIDQLLRELPFAMADLISGAVKEGIENGFKEAYNNVPKSQPNKDDMMIG